jgi:OOP family OmpA-OmpF porin
MNKLFIAIAIILMPFLSNAQFGNLLKKAKNKVEQRVENKIDKEMEKKLDEVEGKETPSANNNSGNTSTPSNEANQPKEEKQSIKSFSKFDFVPGEKILYAEDFSQDAVGELPLTWNASGKGEVMTIDGKQGKWLRAFENTTYLTGNKKSLGDNYTIEFDLMYFFEPKVKGYVMPNWKTGILSSGGIDPTDNTFLKTPAEVNSTLVNFSFSNYGGAQLESRLKNAQTFRSDRMEMGDMMPSLNKVIHYSIQVQKTRFRLWMDERKVFDIPRAINVGDTMNQLYFFLEGSNYKEDEVGLFVSNIKIATGLPDTRHKLIEEGKFSTTGILFDVNAATIKPESNGVLKEVAEAIKSGAGIKVKIIGHTDSDGTDAANLELSKKRSEAVKAALVKDFGIDASALETDGKGEAAPVSDNKTKEGKAQNRRVEFVKL